MKQRGLLEELRQAGLLSDTPHKYSDDAGNLFPHETNFGVGLSQKYLFPMMRLGSTRPRTTRRNGENVWTADAGVVDVPGETLVGGHGGSYSPITGHIFLPSATRSASLVAPHEAAHRSFGVGYPDVREARPYSHQYPKNMGFRATPQEGGGIRPSGKGSRVYPVGEDALYDHRDARKRPHGFDEHEILYLQDWVISKLRGDEESANLFQMVLDGLQLKRDMWKGLPPSQIKYDIKTALAPGSPQRKLIEKWNDTANKKLKELKRPPIPDYKDYINEAIGYHPQFGFSNMRP